MTMKAFVVCKFGYCPLIWMFHSRKLNIQVNKFHERALRIVCQYYASLFSELLEKENSRTLHNRNIQLLAIEIFKLKNGLLPPFMNKAFMEKAQPYCEFRKKLNLSETMLKQCTVEPKLQFF